MAELRFGEAIFYTDKAYPKTVIPKTWWKDIERSVDEPCNDCLFEFELVPWQEAFRQWAVSISESRVKEHLEEPRVIKLAEQIEKEGLQTPPIGGEGFHRLMALIRLRWDIPYVRIRWKTGEDILGAAALIKE